MAPTSLKCFSVAFCKHYVQYSKRYHTIPYNMIQYNVSLWRRTNARNVKTLLCVSAVHSHGSTSSPSTPRALSSARFPLSPGHEAGQYTNIFILQFVSEHCLPAAHYVYYNTISFFQCNFLQLVFFRKVFNLDRESVFNPVIEIVEVLRGLAVIVRERSWKAISFAQFEVLSLMKL